MYKIKKNTVKSVVNQYRIGNRYMDEQNKKRNKLLINQTQTISQRSIQIVDAKSIKRYNVIVIIILAIHLDLYFNQLIKLILIIELF